MSFISSKWMDVDPNGTNIISSPVKMDKTMGVTIPEFLRRNLYKWENSTAFECGISGRKFTHREIFQKALSFAASLKNLGLEQRDAVCLLLPNLIEYPVALMGILDAGLVASPINPVYTPDEVSKQVNDCEGKAIITIPELLPIVQSAKNNCRTLRMTIIIGQVENDDCHSFYELLKTDATDFKPLRGSEINTAEETAIIPYSSGTTGPPKGVEVTHSTLTTNLVQSSHPGYGHYRFFDEGNTQERFIAILPFFHMFGLQGLISRSLFIGAHTVVLPKFEPSTFIKVLKAHKPTTLQLVPPLIYFISSCPAITKKDLVETKAIFAGGAPIGEKLIEALSKKFPEYMFFQEGTILATLTSHLL